jgi:UDP-N-acetylglucosamine acyltransferase
MAIHSTAVVDKKARIDPDAEIGPYAVIEGEVTIGAGTRVYPNAYIAGWTEIGRDCEIHPNAVIGHLPQDFHFEPCRSYCRIGDGTIVREGASIHRGTQPESATIVGKGCFILGFAHIGHNCVFGDNVKLYNMTACSGHVEVADNAIISGYSAVHQFVRIGSYAMVGGLTRVIMDVPPFFTCVHEGECVGVNVVGMRRGGFSREQIADAKGAYRILYRSGKTFRKAVAALAEAVTTDVGRQILQFVQFDSRRGFAAAPTRRRGGIGRPAGERGEADGCTDDAPARPDN